MEWNEKNKFNSFNSFKGLSYYENYKQILKWMDGDPYLPPPIECNLDPYAYCNLNCYFCIVQRYLKYHREEIAMKELPEEYIHRLIDFLADWGVRGLCISGGGEPSLHPKIEWIVAHAVGVMDTSLVTNAIRMVSSSMYCKWVALSVDAADRQTYKKVKGVDKFDEVINNIKRMVNLRNGEGHKVKLCYKFLILPENVSQIYRACKLAKELGVQDFHARPVDFERKDIKNNKRLIFNVERIKEDFEKCHELEDDNFHVYTVTHKFDPEFHVRHDFPSCLATPLLIPILTDGNAYLCVDKKMEEKFKIGSCYPDPENILKWWGSDAHRELIKSVNINECSRCTFSQYNRQIVEIENMDLAFP